jgi:GAF domain-containing protein
MENRNLAKENRQTDSVSELRAQLITILLRVGVIVGLLAAIMGTLDSIQADVDTIWPIFLYWGGYLFVVVLFLWKNAPYRLKAWVFIGILFIIGVTDFLDEGLNGSSQVLLVGTSTLAALLLGGRAAQISTFINVSVMMLFAGLFTQGFLVDPNDIRSSLVSDWLAGTGVMLLVSILIHNSQNFLIPRLAFVISRSQELAAQLQENQASLEQQVQNRTADLEKRNRQLALTAQVTREIATIQNLDKLLEDSVNLISDNFGFNHTAIFLIDETERYAVLRAASSEGGQRMMARGHQLRVGEVGIVGFVTDRGIPRITLDVGTDAVYFGNPDLPETRSEMALPLRIRGQVIGALDVQSSEPSAFTNDDATLLQTIADQVAQAIHNTRLLQEVQTNLETTQRAFGEVSQQAWQKYLGTKTHLLERFDPEGILPKTDEWSAEMAQAATQGIPAQGSISNFPSLAVPITERGQTIGVLNAYKAPEEGRWTQEEISLMEVITEQLGVALESARAYQDTQLAAVREQLTSEATARVRETLDIETIIKTATEEIRQALNLPEVTIRLSQQAPVGPDSRS